MRLRHFNAKDTENSGEEPDDDIFVEETDDDIPEFLSGEDIVEID